MENIVLVNRIRIRKKNDNNLSRGMRSIFHWDGTNGRNALNVFQ